MGKKKKLVKFRLEGVEVNSDVTGTSVTLPNSDGLSKISCVNFEWKHSQVTVLPHHVSSTRPVSSSQSSPTAL